MRGRWLTCAGQVQMAAEKVGDVVHLGVQGVELVRGALDFLFSASVYVVIQLTSQAILGVLAILTHHDHGRLKRGQHGQKQVQKNKWIGIPRGPTEDDVDPRINDQRNEESDDEGP